MIRSTFREGRLYLTLAVLTVVLAGADAMYFFTIDPPAPAAPVAAEPTSSAFAEPLPSDSTLVCNYNPEIPPVADFNALVDESDTVEGNPNSSVTVVEFFEPNCPHCRTFYPTMKQTIAAYGDRARFVIKPVVFWDKSVIQGQALYAAMAEDKLDEMLEAQFAMPKPNGLSEADVRGIATSIGMDANRMMQQIEAGAFRTVAYQARQAFQFSGNKSVPAVLINGRTVSHESRTTACLGKLIDEAAAAQ